MASLNATLEEALAAFGAGAEAVAAGEWAQARTMTYRGRDLALQAQDQLTREGRLLSDPDRRAYAAGASLLVDMLEGVLSFVTWAEAIGAANAAMQAAGTPAEVAAAAYSYEPAARAAEVTALRFDRVAEEARRLLRAEPALAAELGVDGDFVAGVASAARDVREAQAEVDALLEDLVASLGETYVRPQERSLPTLAQRPVLPPGQVSPELATFFHSFDANHDEAVDVEEGRAFFAWVEENVRYRWDDEATTRALPGDLVGDGRPGPDHQQTPTQTWLERRGDCEDMNTLQVAFYNFWGVEAYQAYVNAQREDGLDHAVAIVRVGGTADEFSRILGRLTYYEFQPGNPEGVTPGVYMVVDNAYSSSYGFISGGFDDGRFRIFGVGRLGETLAQAVS